MIERAGGPSARSSTPTSRGMTPVSTTRNDRVTRFAWLPTLLGVLALAALTGPSRGQTPAQTPPRDQQIAEIQKQIEELSKKHDALLKADEAKTEAKPEKLT